MFSTSTTPINGNGDQKDGEDGNDHAGHGDGETSHPWGAAGGSSGNPKGGQGSGANWQSSSSLSWLTNLRKGIMSGGEESIPIMSHHITQHSSHHVCHPFQYGTAPLVTSDTCCRGTIPNMWANVVRNLKRRAHARTPPKKGNVMGLLEYSRPGLSGNAQMYASYFDKHL